jgi:hypothetical protein
LVTFSKGKSHNSQGVSGREAKAQPEALSIWNGCSFYEAVGQEGEDVDSRELPLLVISVYFWACCICVCTKNERKRGPYCAAITIPAAIQALWFRLMVNSWPARFQKLVLSIIS